MTDVPETLVERFQKAVYEHTDHWMTDVEASRVLAAVLPGLAEERRRAIDAALILAAAHDEAARPVVDRDALADEVAARIEGSQSPLRDVPQADMAYERAARDAREAIHASQLVQDAADVRRAMAEEIAADLDECGYYPAATRIRYRLAHGTNGNLGPAAPTARPVGGTP